MKHIAAPSALASVAHSLESCEIFTPLVAQTSGLKAFSQIFFLSFLKRGFASLSPFMVALRIFFQQHSKAACVHAYISLSSFLFLLSVPHQTYSIRYNIYAQSHVDDLMGPKAFVNGPLPRRCSPDNDHNVDALIGSCAALRLP